MKKDLLKGAIRARGMTQADAASRIGISLSRFNAKINETGGAELSLGEAKRLKELLGMSSAEFDQIFL